MERRKNLKQTVGLLNTQISLMRGKQKLKSNTNQLCLCVILDGTLLRLISKLTWKSLEMLNTLSFAELREMKKRLMVKKQLSTREQDLLDLRTSLTLILYLSFPRRLKLSLIVKELSIK
jgi:hypothetical protein